MPFDFIKENIIEPIVDFAVDTLIHPFYASFDLAGSALSYLIDVPEHDREIDVQRNVISTIARIPVLYGERRIGGIRVFGYTPSQTQHWTFVIVLAEGDIEEIGTVYLDGVPIDDPQWGDTASVTRHLGSANQSADPGLVDRFPINWSADHRLRGLAYLVVDINADPEIYSRVPEVTVDAKGRRLYDPRTETTAYSANSALAVLDYLRHPIYGKGIADASIDFASFGAAADIADEQIPAYIDGPMMARFETHGVVDTGRAIRDNLQELLGACRGYLCFTGGKYRLVIDEASSPVFAFTPDNIIGAWTISSGSKKSRLNRAKGRYANPDNDWNADLAPVDSPALRAIDNGLLLERELDLPYETNRYRAEYHAEVALKRSRQGLTVTFTAAPEALAVEVGDVVTVTHPNPGWDEKLFRVMELRLSLDGLVGVMLEEHEPSAYDRTVPVEAPTPPDTSLPDIRVVAPPTDLAVTSDGAYILGADGTVIPMLRVTWTPAVDPYAVGTLIEYRRVGTGDWITGAPPTSPTIGSALVGPVQDGVEWEVRARTVNIAGFRSPAAVETEHVIGKNDPPNDPVGLVIVPSAAGLRLSWTDTPDATRREFTLREGAPFGSATEFARPASSPYTIPHPIAPDDYQYWVAAIDRSGNVSESPSTATISVEPPSTPDVSHQVLGETVVLTWPSAQTTFPISHYLVDGKQVNGRTYSERITWVGERNFEVIAVDVAGNESDAATETVEVLVIPAPSGLTTQGLTYAIRVGLTYTRTDEFEAAELWASTTNNRANARRIAETGDNVINVTGLPLTATRYFWARVRNRYGEYSDWYPASATGGVQGQTSNDPTDYLDALQGHITIDQFAAPLSSRINAIADIEGEIETIKGQLSDIEGLPEFDAGDAYEVGDVVRYDGGLYRAIDDMLTPPAPLPTDDDYWEKIGDYGSIADAVVAHAALISANSTRIDTAEGHISSHAGRLTVIETAVEDIDGELESRATISYVDDAVADEEMARATQYGELSATITDPETGLAAAHGSIQQVAQVAADTQGVVEASYSVVLNANDHITGYRSTVDEEGNSEFTIVSNRFRVVRHNNAGDIIEPFGVGQINGNDAVGIRGDLMVDGSILGRSISSSTTVTAGSGNNVGVLDGAHSTYRIYAGDANPALAPFRVTQTGAVTMTNATIQSSEDSERITINDGGNNQAHYWGNAGAGLQNLAQIGVGSDSGNNYVARFGTLTPGNNRAGAVSQSGSNAGLYGVSNTGIGVVAQAHDGLALRVVPRTGLPPAAGSQAGAIVFNLSDAGLYVLTGANRWERLNHAGMLTNSIGGYIFAWRYGGGVLEGQLYSGSQLFPAGFRSSGNLGADGSHNIAATRGPTSLGSSTVWQARGRVAESSGSTWSRYTLFLRVS